MDLILIFQFNNQRKSPHWANYGIRGVGMVCEKESLNQGRSYESVDISISRCSFSRISQFSGHGGVIYIFGNAYSMSVSVSMFLNCSCSESGGAIFSGSLNTVLRMVCAHRCSCGDSQWGHFAYIAAEHESRIEYLSYTSCSYKEYGRWSVSMNTGNQTANSINCSMNHAFMNSGIVIQTPSSLKFSHCTFANNNVSDSGCIALSETSETLSFANIIHNNSPTKYGVVFSDIGTPKMQYCIFDMNRNTLFCVWSGSLEVSHSYISRSGLFSASTAVSTANNSSFTKRQTYQIQFFGSRYCNADDPIPVETPKQTEELDNNKTDLGFFYFLVFLFLIIFAVVYCICRCRNNKSTSGSSSSTK